MGCIFVLSIITNEIGNRIKSEQLLKMTKFTGKKVAEVLETKAYSMFKFRGDNRTINTNHVKYLTKKMKEKGWLKTSTVVVNGSGEIIDGQHRVKAAIEAGVPIRFRVERRAGIEEITEMNMGQKNWSPFDHIHKYVALNNENYIKFDQFVKEFPTFRITECAMFLNNGISSVDRKVFEEGRWVAKDMDIARKYANNVLSLKPYFEKGYNKAIFVRAIIKIMVNKSDVFDFNQFIHKIKLRPNMIFMCGTVDQYIEMIESLYNYKRIDKVNLRF